MQCETLPRSDRAVCGWFTVGRPNLWPTLTERFRMTGNGMVRPRGDFRYPSPSTELASRYDMSFWANKGLSHFADVM